MGGHTVTRKMGQGEKNLPSLFQNHGVASDLVPLQHRVSGREFVQIAKGGVIEAGIEEQVSAAAGHQSHEAYVDQLRSQFTDDVDAKQLHVIAIEDELQKAGLVTDNLPSRIMAVICTPDNHV